MKKRILIVKRIIFVFVCFSMLILLVGYRVDNTSLAVITKVIQEVTKKSETADWTKAEKGDMLYNGNQVRTGEKSLGIVKFKDNSIVRLREKSELTVHGEGQRGAIIKQAHLNRGSFGFDIQKQGNDQFRLTSPTSVASIRGTKGKWSSANGSDTLIITEGIVNLKNIVSNNEVDVSAGYIGFSEESGLVTSRKATEEELAQATIAVGGGATNELKFEMQDSKGNKKELKIKYK